MEDTNHKIEPHPKEENDPTMLMSAAALAAMLEGFQTPIDEHGNPKKAAF